MTALGVPPRQPQSGDALTDRERQVLDLVSRGLTNGGIAARLHITEHTVKAHVRNLRGRLDAHDRAHAVRRGFQLKLLTADEVDPMIATAQCAAVYGGELWSPLPCREQAGHSQVPHVDSYEWGGVDHQDEHGPHAHHVDRHGRTWSDDRGSGLATLAAVRAAYGDDLPPTAAARLEAIGCALITLRSHEWLHRRLGADPGVDCCICGWEGDDHSRHVAEQLWATGALDRHTGPVAEVVAAARGYADRMRHTPGWETRLTVEARRVVVAVDDLDNPGGGS